MLRLGPLGTLLPPACVRPLCEYQRGQWRKGVCRKRAYGVSVRTSTSVWVVGAGAERTELHKPLRDWGVPATRHSRKRGAYANL